MPLAAAVLALTSVIPASAAQAVEARSTASACPGNATSDPWFWDMSRTTPFAESVACLRYWQVTKGQADGSYRPRESVTRAEMATFIKRTIERSGGSLPSTSRDYFTDDNASPHQSSLNALAAAGIMRGDGRGRVEPYGRISRIEMAALLVRGHDYRAQQAGRVPLAVGSDAFTDDNGYALSREVNKAAAVGVVAGTGARTFSPAAPVRRDHMAAFLTRLLDVQVVGGLSRVPAPPPASPRPVAPAPTSLLTSLEQNVLDEINAYRRGKGLRALAPDKCLTEAARAWSAKMARAGGLSHGQSVCANRSWAENVAYAYKPGDFFELWRDSSGHRANMLRSGATKVGVGIVAVRDSYGIRYYATTQSD